MTYDKYEPTEVSGEAAAGRGFKSPGTTRLHPERSAKWRRNGWQRQQCHWSKGAMYGRNTQTDCEQRGNAMTHMTNMNKYGTHVFLEWFGQRQKPSISQNVTFNFDILWTSLSRWIWGSQQLPNATSGMPASYRSEMKPLQTFSKQLPVPSWNLIINISTEDLFNHQVFDRGWSQPAERVD